jgi:hypothetical protein
MPLTRGRTFTGRAAWEGGCENRIAAAVAMVVWSPWALAFGCDAAMPYRRDDVSNREFHRIWIEQCEAAEDIRLRYGPQAAFDYVVGEKLLNFAEAAARRPEFARELPRFVARVRGLFTPEELQTHITRIESPRAAAERARQFSTIKELLSAAELGTS